MFVWCSNSTVISLHSFDKSYCHMTPFHPLNTQRRSRVARWSDWSGLCRGWDSVRSVHDVSGQKVSSHSVSEPELLSHWTQWTRLFQLWGERCCQSQTAEQHWVWIFRGVRYPFMVVSDICGIQREKKGSVQLYEALVTSWHRVSSCIVLVILNRCAITRPHVHVTQHGRGPTAAYPTLQKNQNPTRTRGRRVCHLTHTHTQKPVPKTLIF